MLSIAPILTARRPSEVQLGLPSPRVVGVAVPVAGFSVIAEEPAG
jgi:hypothetical protein